MTRLMALTLGAVLLAGPALASPPPPGWGSKVKKVDPEDQSHGNIPKPMAPAAVIEKTLPEGKMSMRVGQKRSFKGKEMAACSNATVIRCQVDQNSKVFTVLARKAGAAFIIDTGRAGAANKNMQPLHVTVTE